MGSASSAPQIRILLFLHSFGPGGVERVALRLAGTWAGAGHDVRLLMGRNEGPDRSVAPHNLIYDFAPPHPLARPFETLWMVFQLVAAVRRHRPDVLFCAGNTYTIVAALVRLILGSECPPIVCKLSNSLDRQDLPLLPRLAHRFWLRQHRHFIDRFVGLSLPMRKQIEDFLAVPPNRVSIIPNPVLSSAHINELASAPLPERSREGRRFVAVGRLTAQKNFHLLLRAFALVARPDDRLLIIGDGPFRRRLEREAARLGIDGQVEMPGHRDSVATFLSSSDVFVSSSNYEGMPGAVVEALAVGLPIVATCSSACLSALLGGGQLGRLVPIRDVGQLAEALRDAPARHDVPLPTLRAVAAQYTVERAAHLYVDLFAAAAVGAGRLSATPVLEPVAEAA